jgi:hypothetical protein
VKVLIRHTTNHLLYSRAGTWVASRDAARDFKTTLAALEHCTFEKLSDVALLLAFDDQRMDRSLPVADRAAASKLALRAELKSFGGDGH